MKSTGDKITIRYVQVKACDGEPAILARACNDGEREGSAQSFSRGQRSRGRWRGHALLRLHTPARPESSVEGRAFFPTWLSSSTVT